MVLCRFFFFRFSRNGCGHFQNISICFYDFWMGTLLLFVMHDVGLAEVMTLRSFTPKFTFFELFCSFIQPNDFFKSRTSRSVRTTNAHKVELRKGIISSES